MSIAETKLRMRLPSGKLVQYPVTIVFVKGRIEFVQSPFELKDEIKAMKGARWHGHDASPRKIWSIDDCFRNRFQLAFLQGDNVFEWFDRPLIHHEYERPLMPHQRDLADHGLTYHYQIWAAEMGTGKTLAAQEVIERSGVDRWFWVGPKSSLPNIERELDKWGMDKSVQVDFYTYDKLRTEMDFWPVDEPPPRGVVFDESSKLKTPGIKRTLAAQKLADMIRQHYKFDGYVLLMSGTPSPKTPTDWWAQCEIAWPGFLREGSKDALKARLAFLRRETVAGQPINRLVGWKDDEQKCNQCGQHATCIDHDARDAEPSDYHRFQPSKNEVAYLFDRLKGLVSVKHKKDCLELPEKQYHTVVCKPNPSVLRVAKAIFNSSDNHMTGLSLLRELSDGFQYREEQDGTKDCNHCGASGKVFEWFDPEDRERIFEQTDLLDPDEVAQLEKVEVDCRVCGGSGQRKNMVRFAREVPCPKVAALKGLLEENEEGGRIVIFAGFTGSVDRCVKVCHGEGWSTLRCDGRGFQLKTTKGEIIKTQKPLDYWSEMDNPRVAFVAHPESGGMSFTLTEARTAVFYSNSFKGEFRVQAEDRIHRAGMDMNRGATIVDLVHLPTDEHVLEVIRENRRLELLTMGEIENVLR